MTVSPIGGNLHSKVKVLLDWRFEDTFYDILIIRSSDNCGGRYVYKVSQISANNLYPLPTKRPSGLMQPEKLGFEFVKHNEK